MSIRGCLNFALLLSSLLATLQFVRDAWSQNAPQWSQMGGSDKATELIVSGRFAEAIPVAKAQLAAAEARVGKDHPDLLKHLQTLGTACFARQDYDEAEIAYRRGLDIVLRSFGKADPRVMEFSGTLFAIYTIQKRPAEAQAMMKLTRPPQ